RRPGGAAQPPAPHAAAARHPLLGGAYLPPCHLALPYLPPGGCLMRPQKMTAGLFLMGALLAALAAFSAQMCLNDAFSLGADRTILLAVAVFAALASAALLFL